MGSDGKAMEPRSHEQPRSNRGVKPLLQLKTFTLEPAPEAGPLSFSTVQFAFNELRRDREGTEEERGRENWEVNMDAQDEQDFGIDSRKAREGRKEREEPPFSQGHRRAYALGRFPSVLSVVNPLPFFFQVIGDADEPNCHTPCPCYR